MSTPFENSAAAILLRERIRNLQSRKTQADIAKAAGFQNANFISILKAGKSKIPLDRVPDLARVIEVDPARLMWLALEQSIWVASAAAVLTTFGRPVTANELAWLTEMRNPSATAIPRSRPRRGPSSGGSSEVTVAVL